MSEDAEKKAKKTSKEVADSIADMIRIALPRVEKVAVALRDAGIPCNPDSVFSLMWLAARVAARREPQALEKTGFKVMADLAYDLAEAEQSDSGVAVVSLGLPPDGGEELRMKVQVEKAEPEAAAEPPSAP